VFVLKTNYGQKDIDERFTNNPPTKSVDEEELVNALSKNGIVLNLLYRKKAIIRQQRLSTKMAIDRRYDSKRNDFSDYLLVIHRPYDFDFAV
jgi:hypothetical protein